MKNIEVVAAIICNNMKNPKKIYTTQRGYGDLAGGWEFPGGKIESGEAPEAALQREIMEELDTKIKVGKLLEVIDYDYPNFHLHMYCYLAEVVEGNLVLKEHQAGKWIGKEELFQVGWLPADVLLLGKLCELMGTSYISCENDGMVWEYDEDDEFEEEDDIVFKRYFLVDYENVNRDGLNGVTKLATEDCVRIYYSEAAETLTFGLHRRINASKAHFDYIKVQMPIKNAVDCQILFDIRDLSKENRQAEYFIVSKDSDFDKAVEDFKGRKLKVKKVEEICKLTEKKTVPEQKKATTTNNTKVAKKKATNSSQKDKREAQIRSFFGQHFKKKIYVERKEEVIELLIKAKTKQEVNNGLLKHFANETVSAMLKTLEPLIKDLPGR